MRCFLAFTILTALTCGCLEPVSQPDTAPQAAAQPVLPPLDEPPSELEMTDFVAGQNMRERGGALSQTVVQIQNTEIWAELDVKVKHAMQLYQASNGNLPKDHETFMRDIVQPNNIKLPQLKPGYEYWYNGETGQLMKRPAPRDEVEDSEEAPTDAATEESASE